MKIALRTPHGRVRPHDPWSLCVIILSLSLRAHDMICFAADPTCKTVAVPPEYMGLVSRMESEHPGVEARARVKDDRNPVASELVLE
jgi:hypothetical protein